MLCVNVGWEKMGTLNIIHIVFNVDCLLLVWPTIIYHNQCSLSKSKMTMFIIRYQGGVIQNKGASMTSQKMLERLLAWAHKMRV